MSFYSGPCPESVSRHDADRDGRCFWCRRKVDYPVRRPTEFTRTEDQSYRYFYDPDFGSGRHDIF